MGLFGSIGRVLGKVAKAGLNQVTHGASDMLLKQLKGRGQQKPLTSKLSTVQQAALANKLFAGEKPPSTSRIESVLEEAAGGAPTRANSGRPKSKRRYTGKPKPQLPSFSFGRSRSAPKPKPAPKSKPKKKRGPTKQSQKMVQLAKEWRGLGGQAGTGQTFFAWKVGR